MLVLSRRCGETILIGDQIAVTVSRIGPNNVRIGIEAPRDMKVIREELEPRVERYAQHQPATAKSREPETVPAA